MIVYNAVNTINNKVYVGATLRSLNTRKAEHKSRAILGELQTPLHQAIKKYGWDVFTWRVLETCGDRESLYEAEKKWVAHFNSNLTDQGYNLTNGGLGSEGYIATESAKEKISNIHKGRKQSPEEIEKRIAPLRGRKRPEHVIAKMRGRVVSEETRHKISNSGKGRKYKLSKKGLEGNIKAARKRSLNGVGVKIKPSFAGDILSRRKLGESFAAIANSYNVTPSTVFYFCKRQMAA